MSRFIGYPSRQVVGVFDSRAAAERAVAAMRDAGANAATIQVYEGAADSERFDATGARHGILARLRRMMQFGLMDQLPAMAWYEAALREGKVVVAVPTTNRQQTLRAVEAMKVAGGHFINRFGRLDTEEFARWRGPEPAVSDLMRH
jgi:hypothetical protein